jgi:long-subunit fatty acid transport protein
MGGAMAALCDDYTATFYNPAALSQAVGKGKWLQLGITGLYENRDFEARDTAGSSTRYDGGETAFALGMAMDLGRPEGWKNWTLGLCVYLPTKAVLDIDIPESSKDYFFPLYNDVGKGMNAFVGLSRRFGDRVSLGVGATCLLRLMDTDSHIVAFLDANKLLQNQDLINSLVNKGGVSATDAIDVKVAVNRELVLKLSLNAGLTLQILDWLKLGLSFRDKTGADSTGYQYIYIEPVDANGNVVKDLADNLPVIQVAVDYYAFFSPREYTAGIGITSGRLNLEADISYAEWSGYRGPHYEWPVPGFKDTWNPRFGVEYGLTEKFLLRAGYMWRPTPAPSQTGEYNYLDSDTHIFSGGAAYRIGSGSVDAHVQYQYMPDQTVNKTGGLPSVTYGGNMLNAGLTYTVRY